MLSIDQLLQQTKCSYTGEYGVADQCCSKLNSLTNEYQEAIHIGSKYISQVYNIINFILLIQKY